MKCRSEKGMTLSETLVAVLIMSLVTMAIAAGVTAGSRVYNRMRIKAEAQTLLSTNVDALTGYLEKEFVIKNTTPSDSIDIKFSEVSDTTVHIYNNTDNDHKGIYIDYLDSSNPSEKADDNVDAQPLISDASNTSGLHAELSDVTTDGKVTTFTITVKDQSGKTAEDAKNVKVMNLVHYPEGTPVTNP